MVNTTGMAINTNGSICITHGFPMPAGIVVMGVGMTDTTAMVLMLESMKCHVLHLVRAMALQVSRL